METNKKLYRVTLRGMTCSLSGTAYGISYVVATDPAEAYNKVKAFLDEKDIGFTGDRQLKQIELLAEEEQYNLSGQILYL